MTEPEATGSNHPTEDDGHTSHDGTQDDQQEPARKRQRVRLSCLECRRRKLSCSRELPCDRCLKSGTPERCNYESRPGGPTTTASSGEKPSFSPVSPLVSFGQDSRRSAPGHPPARRELDSSVLREAARYHDRIRKLELEVTQLRSALSKQASVDGSTVVASPANGKEATAKEAPPGPWGPSFVPETADGLEVKFLRGNNFKTKYFGPHNAWSSLRELSGICPFMKETADEWLRPLNIQRKDRAKRKEDREKQFLQPDPFLDSFFPSKEETDSLIAVYLDQFEQLHRIIHIPTFKKEYETFWDPSKPRCASFAALVLAMISVSCCLDMQASNKFVGVQSSAFQTAEKWIKACDQWCDQQSQKHRKLVHYQIACLLYLAKRVNIIKKKRFWTTSGALIREGITVGLHHDPDHVSIRITPYNREMRRRLWATMIEFDVQASFDQGVPTLLSQVYNDTDAPRNVDDESFDEDSAELPVSRPRTEYTFSSYAHISRQSLPLRLELNKLLTGPPVDLEWEQVLQYSDMISQEIDALPAWDLECEKGSEVSHKPILAHTLLHLQLRQYLIPLNQSYLRLRKYHSRYQTAELLYYNAARDIVLMHDRLFQKGIRTLYFLREDTMNAAINLCNVSLFQPRDSTGLIMSNARETLKLIEKCIALKEDRVLRCGNNDPWGYSSMCAACGLLETHLGIKTSEAAKASSAERFISLHYKLLAYQIPQFPGQQPQESTATPQPNQVSTTSEPSTVNAYTTHPPSSLHLGNPLLHREGLPLSMPWLLPTTDSGQLLVPNPDVNFEMLGSDLNELWGDWGGTEFM